MAKISELGIPASVEGYLLPYRRYGESIEEYELRCNLRVERLKYENAMKKEFGTPGRIRTR